MTKKDTEDSRKVRTSEGLKPQKKKTFVLRIGKLRFFIIYSIAQLVIGNLLGIFLRGFPPSDLAEERVVNIATIQTGLCGAFIAFIGLVIFFYFRKIFDVEKDAISKSFEYSVKFAEFANSQEKIEEWHKKEINHYYKTLPSKISDSVNFAIKIILLTWVLAIALFLVSVILVQFSLAGNASLLSLSLIFTIHGIGYFVYSWVGYEEVLRCLREATLLLEEAITAVKLELTFYPKGRSK